MDSEEVNMLLVLTIIALVGLMIISLEDRSNDEVSEIAKDIREESISRIKERKRSLGYSEEELKDIPYNSVYTEKEEDRGF